MENIKTLEDYLEDSNTKEYALALIQRGTCFVTIKSDKGLKFFPSRFIGYKNNSLTKHEGNNDKDGRITNAAISGILNSEPVVDDFYDNEYKKYCIRLGLTPSNKGSFGVARKFWTL